MKTLKKATAVLLIIIGLAELFFSPIIWDWYWKFFNIKEGANSAMLVFFFLGTIICIGFLVGKLLQED